MNKFLSIASFAVTLAAFYPVLTDEKYKFQVILIMSCAFLMFIILSFMTDALINYLSYRKNRIKGTYISFYDDGEKKGSKGSKQRKKAIIWLKQKGKQVEGITKDCGHSGEEREWKLKGLITENGLLSGSYQCTDKKDGGKGVFFLEPVTGKEGDFSGVWAGYDSAKRKIFWGSYKWRKLIDIKIIRINLFNKNHVTKAMSILGSSLGNRYIDRTFFYRYSINRMNAKLVKIFWPILDLLYGDKFDKVNVLKSAEEKKTYSFSLGALFKGDLVGVLLAEILDENETKFFESISHKNLSMYKVGFLKSLAVSEYYRQKGVGTSLTDVAINKLKRKGCTAIFLLHWDSKTSQSSLGVVDSIGFKQIGVANEFWKEDSLKRQYSCPVCGNPCKCSAIVFFKEL